MQSKDGSSYFDLENGKIVGKNAEMTGSFIATAANGGSTYTTKIESKWTSDGNGVIFYKDNSRIGCIGSSLSGGVVVNTDQTLGLASKYSDITISSNYLGSTMHPVINLTNKTDYCLSELVAYKNALNGHALGVRSNTGAFYGRLNGGNWIIQKLYHSENLQCGYEKITPSYNSSLGLYVGNKTVSFSPAFAKSPIITVTPVTGGPYSCIASITDVTANSFKIQVQRKSSDATSVHWIAVEPR